MANGTVVTRKGLQLITKLVASETALTFTRVAIGTGKVPGGYDPGSMTGLNEYKMDGSIASHSASGDEASVVMQISSIGVETGFTITEAGLFATDPDEGEILYAYLDMSADPQYMYPANNAISKFIEMTLVVKIGEVQSVTAVINPGSLVTKEKFSELEYPVLPEIDESKNEQNFMLDGMSLQQMLAQFAYVRSHYAKSIDLSEEKNTSVHRKDIVNSFEGVGGNLNTVMGTMLGQQHDQDIDYLKNYGLLKSMLTNQNVDSLDKIPTAYLLYQLNKDLLEKYADLLEKYNTLNSNLTSILPFNNTIKDFNDAASFGIYCGLDLKNTPKSGHVTVLTVPIGSGRSGNTGYCRQLAFPASTNMIYARYRRDGNWNQWAVLHE